MIGKMIEEQYRYYKMKNYKQSFDTLSILESESCVATGASVGEVVVGLAEHINGLALTSFVVESGVALDAHVRGVISIAILDFKLSVNLGDLTDSVEN